MSDIEPALRESVRQRAAGFCEYCRISEQFTLTEHEIDHVIAVKHGGETVAGNLAIRKRDNSPACFIRASIVGTIISRFAIVRLLG